MKGKTQGEPTFLKKKKILQKKLKSCSSLGSLVPERTPGKVTRMLEAEDGGEPGKQKAKESPCCCLQGAGKVEPDLRRRRRL